MADETDSIATGVGLATGNPWIGPAVSLFNGIFGSDSQEDINSANLAQARNQQDFQERMSNTAHQREARDLELAGMNPILTANRSGASSPSGSMAVLSSPYQAGINAASGAAATHATWANSAKVAQETKTEAARTSLEEYKVRQNEWILSKKGMFDSWMANQVWSQEYSTEALKETVNKVVAEVSNLAKAGKLLDEQAARTNVQAALDRLGIPEAKAFADMFSSKLGHEIPWKREAEGIVNSAVRGAIRRF